jgi:hypothetical protein
MQEAALFTSSTPTFSVTKHRLFLLAAARDGEIGRPPALEAEPVFSCILTSTECAGSPGHLLFAALTVAVHEWLLLASTLIVSHKTNKLVLTAVPIVALHR